MDLPIVVFWGQLLPTLLLLSFFLFTASCFKDQGTDRLDARNVTLLRSDGADLFYTERYSCRVDFG